MSSGGAFLTGLLTSLLKGQSGELDRSSRNAVLSPPAHTETQSQTQPHAQTPLLAEAGRSRSSLGVVIENLSKCDVKASGMCCYFPNFCDPLAKCVAETAPSNIFEISSMAPRCECPWGFTGDGRRRDAASNAPVGGLLGAGGLASTLTGAGLGGALAPASNGELTPGCVNIDECATGVAHCEHECIDLAPGYQCRCNSGFELNQDGRTCSDIDECALSRSISPQAHSHSHTHSHGLNNYDGRVCEQTCVNTIGGYNCGCHKGYRLAADDRSCEDVDECFEAKLNGFDLCQFEELCVNLPGSFACKCPSGFRPSPTEPTECEDVDECLELAAPCPDARAMICENTVGAYSCSCLPGLTSTTTMSQSNDDESRLTTDDRRVVEGGRKLDLSCLESPAAMACPFDLATLTLFLAEERSAARQLQCKDVDECATLSPCGDATCVNLFRGYECVCEQEGSRYDDELRTCVDINECLVEGGVSGPCPDDEICINLPGSYRCVCSTGYTRLPAEDGQCVDVNECEDASGAVCPPYSSCLNSPGSFACVCDDGYYSFYSERSSLSQPSYDHTSDDDPSIGETVHDVGLLACEEVDECALEFCPGACRNIKPGGRRYVGITAPPRGTPVGYECACPRGFQEKPDTDVCEDIDECDVFGAENLCAANAQCVNTSGSFECVCPQHKQEIELIKGGASAPPQLLETGSALNANETLILTLTHQLAARLSDAPLQALLANNVSLLDLLTAFLTIPSQLLSLEDVASASEGSSSESRANSSMAQAAGSARSSIANYFYTSIDWQKANRLHFDLSSVLTDAMGDGLQGSRLPKEQAHELVDELYLPALKRSPEPDVKIAEIYGQILFLTRWSVCPKPVPILMPSSKKTGTTGMTVAKAQKTGGLKREEKDEKPSVVEARGCRRVEACASPTTPCCKNVPYPPNTSSAGSRSRAGNPDPRRIDFECAPYVRPLRLFGSSPKKCPTGYTTFTKG